MNTGDASRISRLKARYAACDLCPRDCGVDRTAGELGFCGEKDLVRASRIFSHHGEEPPISGTRGSGTVFLTGCSLKCVFCQNYQISIDGMGEYLSTKRLVSDMLRVQQAGVHNINFVTPTHFTPSLVEAVLEARAEGLTIPIVWNTSGYEHASVIRELDSVVDIYLADLKYGDAGGGSECADAPDYFDKASKALKVMVETAGPFRMDEDGIAVSGVIVRHLVLPNGLSSTPRLLRFLGDNFKDDVFISLMAQYQPCFKAQGDSKLGRRISMDEWKEALDALEQAGLSNGWVQDHAGIDGGYLPDFTSKEGWN